MEVPDHILKRCKPTAKDCEDTSSIHHDNPLPLLPQQQTVNVLVVDDEQHNKLPPPPDSEPDRVVSITDRIDQACQNDVPITCPKVPDYLRVRAFRLYVPQIASIGPYHHGKKWLTSMDQRKWRFLQQMLKRTGHDVNIYWNGLKKIEDRIRACYEGPISFESDKFVEMILLDGCFILELFRGATDGFEKLGYARNDPVFSMRGSMHRIQRDLIMLENQLPLFVLDLLLGIQLGQPEQKGLVSELALRFFYPLTPTYKFWQPYESTFDPMSVQNSLHCLEVFHRGLFPKRESDSNGVADKGQQLQLIHCVTDLREVGIKFKIRMTDHFWDVKFQKGILEIPKLLIHDGTKSLFLNLIAFEQCHPDCSSNITSYVIFMDNLINSPEDVRHLHRCGIIEHRLGSDAEVDDLFNRLSQEVVFDTSKSYLSTVSYEVNNYVTYWWTTSRLRWRWRWSTWLASLKRDYFSSPWAIISLFAAVILLLLTLAQTFYTVYGYYIPRGN